MSDKIKIVTHSSKYHTDDVFAVATLLLLLEGKDVEIIRSREEEIIKMGDYVVDVGNMHNPETKRFDHHQIGGAGVRSNGVPYASFGLVWKEFGLKLSGGEKEMAEIDRAIVQPIDALDNGLKFLETNIPGLQPFDVGFITHLFAPTWKEEEVDIDEVFLKLVSYAKEILKREIAVVKAKIEAEKFVIEAYNNSIDKRIVELDERYPWEEVLSKFPEPLFVIYKKRIDNNWSLKSIRNDSFSFEPRKRLPESWAGKRDEELEKVTGIKGAKFCHNARFLGVTQTRAGILKMAELALNS